MREGWLPAPSVAIRKDEADSEQLRLPLFREVSSRTGLLSRNTEFGEKVRRFLQKHLPNGSVGRISGQLGTRTSRVYDELEGRVVLSFDVAWAALCLCGREQQFRACAALLKPFGFIPFDLSTPRDLEESA